MHQDPNQSLLFQPIDVRILAQFVLRVLHVHSNYQDQLWVIKLMNRNIRNHGTHLNHADTDAHTAGKHRVDQPAIVI